MEDVRAGQPLLAAPDILLTDNARFLPGGLRWRPVRLRWRPREDARVAFLVSDGADAARLAEARASDFVKFVAARPELVADDFSDYVSGHPPQQRERHFHQERDREYCSRSFAVVARRMLVAPFILQRRDNDGHGRERHAGAERGCDEPRRRVAVAQASQRDHARAKRDAARRHREPQRRDGETISLVRVWSCDGYHGADQPERAQLSVELYGERDARCGDQWRVAAATA